MYKCDYCPYEKVGRIYSTGNIGLPTKWKLVNGRLLCRQCAEMSKRMLDNGSTKRAFAYLRASLTKQEMTIEVQKQIITEYCKVRGLEIVDFFIDKASASKNKFTTRTAGRQVYTSAARGDHIVFAKYDRAFRDVIDCLTMFKRWQRQNIHMHFAAEGGLLPANSQGKFLLTMMVAVAENEASNISARVSNVNNLRRHQMRPLLGKQLVTGFMAYWPPDKEYKSQKERRQDKRMILIPDEYENGKLFYDWRYRDGLSEREIESLARENEIRVPKEARDQDDRIQEFYSRQRIVKLIRLQHELIETEKAEGREMDLHELSYAWQKHYYITDRTRVTFRNRSGGKRDHKSKRNSELVETIWDSNGDPTE